MIGSVEVKIKKGSDTENYLYDVMGQLGSRMESVPLEIREPGPLEFSYTFIENITVAEESDDTVTFILHARKDQ